MILPQTYGMAIFLLILSTICLGSWASTYKASGWRFELYYFDFAFAVLITAVILAFTLGSMGFDGFTFLDDVLHAGKRPWFDSFMAGVIFSLANMFLMGAITVAGLSIAYPISAGIALIVAVGINLVSKSAGNPMLCFGGLALVLVSILVAGATYRFINEIRHEASARAGKAKSTRRPVAIKGIILAVISGLLLTASFPLLADAKAGEVGLGPYSIITIFALGLFLSTFVFNLFFMNLPVDGEPVDFTEYFRAPATAHGWAVLGGVIWCVGALAGLTAASSENIHIGASLAYGLNQAPTLLAMLWGVLVWKEFKDGDARTKSLLGILFLLFTVGVALISMGQVAPVRY